MSHKPITGVLPVIQTPYLPDETIDSETLAEEISWLYERGVDGIVVAMVSEILRLSSEEREELAKLVCRHNNGRGTAIISVGAESTKVAERYAKQAESVGADALMAIPPTNTALGEPELAEYYKRILRAVKVPVIVQDASGYVGRPMSIALQSSLLLDFGPDRVLYKPEATPLGPRLSQLRDATGGKAKIFEGSGGIALVDNFRRGIEGTMPGADLIEGIVALWRALKAGDNAKVYRISGPLGALVSLQTGLDGFLAVEKYLLVKQGVFKNTLVRGPVGFHLDPETRSEIDRLFDLVTQAVKA